MCKHFNYKLRRNQILLQAAAILLPLLLQLNDFDTNENATVRYNTVEVESRPA